MVTTNGWYEGGRLGGWEDECSGVSGIIWGNGVGPLNPHLIQLFLNILTERAVTTEAGSLFQCSLYSVAEEAPFY